MTSTYAVLSEGLEKRFGEVHALRGLDLAVAPGTVCSILGPNGAGKTTAVRLLTTLLRPDSGSARVAGHDLVREPEAVRRAIAVTGQYASVDGDLTGRENLRLFARLHRVRGPAERAAELLDRFGLAEAADRTASTYSGGMRRRLDLAASLVRRPEILFLDEPTTGLDPASRNLIWDGVRELTADGTTVLLTTQYLEEADQLAHDIALVDQGRVAHTGSPAQLKALIGAHVEIVVADADVLVKAAGVLDQLTGGAPSFDHERNSVGAVTQDTTLTLPRLVRELDTAGVPLLDASIRPPTLDDVFLRLTKELAV
ncbi:MULTISPECIES: ATP-binding cassette domain-containing protein [unclassified Streptomyces]|uniref:ATP-binding cassette domain-containing protein n=1 Tax=unclassified Streptomyces TaxID=2593676 RepID=UPI002474624A|nr:MULTISPECIES: ATP-binding cassette domain-containing protein [unclassified Streptomyces]MDH6448814.1 ABC-2 type transport system ATP-binding protein [Streptomyces sp. SAI-119]MDH6500605.1 ABC-2 type transport system ATP-binding protein [Streptomyces sp. SAI-149]